MSCRVWLRQLRAKKQVEDPSFWFQSGGSTFGMVNYPAADVPHTRVAEYKHLTGQTHPQTSITYEVPSADGNPYYPIPCPETQALYRRYEALADAETQATFAGRLGSYPYYNMDQVVAQAPATYRKLTEAAESEPLPRAG